MKALQTTLFLIAFVVLGTQTVRHIYVKWIEPTRSVLEAYGEPVDSAITKVSHRLLEIERRERELDQQRDALITETESLHGDVHALHATMASFAEPQRSKPRRPAGQPPNRR